MGWSLWKDEGGKKNSSFLVDSLSAPEEHAYLMAEMQTCCERSEEWLKISLLASNPINRANYKLPVQYPEKLIDHKMWRSAVYK